MGLEVGLESDSCVLLEGSWLLSVEVRYTPVLGNQEVDHTKVKPWNAIWPKIIAEPWPGEM